jgi:hypothetical protein
VGSVGTHWATQKAMVVQLRSFGQLVAFRQQLATMQAMHAGVDLQKITAAPGHVAPSSSTPAPLSPAAAPSPGDELRPPTTSFVHGMPFVSVHPPRNAGFGLPFDEHADAASSAPRTPAMAMTLTHFVYYGALGFSNLDFSRPRVAHEGEHFRSESIPLSLDGVQRATRRALRSMPSSSIASCASSIATCLVCLWTTAAGSAALEPLQIRHKAVAVPTTGPKLGPCRFRR